MSSKPSAAETLSVQTLLRVARQTQPLDDHRFESVVLFLATGRSLGAGLAQFFQKLDLSRHRFIALVALHEFDPTPFAAADFATHIGIGHKAMSALLEQLAARGWIERHLESNVPRTVFVSVTPSGRDAAKLAIDSFLQLAAELARDLHADDQAMLAAACTKLRQRAAETFA